MGGTARLRLSLPPAAVAAALVAAGAAVGTTVAVPAATLAARHPAAPVRGGTLTLAAQTPPQSLDPARCQEYVCAEFDYLAFNTLVTYSPTSSAIEPSLAVRWKVSDGGRTYTFYLRRGVTFSNGDPLTAQDVVYTMTRVNEPYVDAPYQGVFSALVGGEQLFKGKLKAQTLPGLRAVGKYEVVMHLVQPEGYWLNVMALPSASIVDPSVAKVWNAIYTEKSHATVMPIGTGPFILQPYQASTTQYVWKRNPHYWQAGLPYLNTLVIKVNVPAELQLEQFERGQIGAIPSSFDSLNLTPSQYLQIRGNPTLRKEYVLRPEIGVNFLSIDYNIKPFNNLYLREAIQYALNKKDIAAVMTNGRAGIANSVLPPGMPGYDPSMNLFPVQDTPAGLAAAHRKVHALLVKAGYPHGVNIGDLVVAPGLGGPQLATLVASQLGQVGIHVTVRTVNLSVLLQLGDEGKIGFGVGGWYQDYPDPQDFMYNLFDSHQIPGTNGFYDNPEVDHLVETADALTRMKQRLPLYLKAERIVLSSATFVPLYWAWQDGLIGPNVYPKTPSLWFHPVLPAQLAKVWVKG
jgi:oligopeptide transport system substrate-binding protein